MPRNYLNVSPKKRKPADARDARFSPRPRRAPRQERARATVDAITDAAASLLVERGYDRVSTNLIARRAGVSIGSLYQYFPGKEAIYAAIIEAHAAEMQALGEAATSTVGDAGVDFATALRSVLEGMLAVHARDDDLLRAVERELMQIYPAWGATRRQDDRLVSALAEVLDRRDDCFPADSGVAARIVVTICHGVVRWLLHEAPADTPQGEYVQQTIALCCLAVGFRSGGALGVPA